MIISLLVAVLYKTFKFIYKLIRGESEILEGYSEEWFGREEKHEDKSEDKSIRPFSINVPEEVLSDLKRRLENTRFEDPLIDSKFQYGFNDNVLRNLVKYWKDEYQWRTQESELNKYSHFKTRIEGIDVHFIHVKPVFNHGENLKVLPLLLIHGWPGSIIEFQKIIPLLTTAQPNCDFVFEIICPSIPGYGFSESPHRKGFNARAAARVFVTLMERLGHNKFYVQGGDWGSYIGQLIAKFYSPKVIGLHLNMVFVSKFKWWDFIKFSVIAFFPFLVSSKEYKMLYPFKKKMSWLYSEMGYMHIQSTKPDTVGSGMCDSPAGMAAYILEKFSTWVNKEYIDLDDGGLTEKLTYDELLTNVMLYWVNNNFKASVRFYKENSVDLVKDKYSKIVINVPLGLALFPNELLGVPRTLLSQQAPNIVSYNMMARGGHFAAFEEPQLLADDIWQFVKLVEKK